MAKKKAPPKPPVKPYVWKQAAKVNWFPSINQPKPGGGFTLRPGIQPGSLGAILGNSGQTTPTARPSGGGGGGASGILADYLNQMRADSSASSNADKGSMIQNLRNAIVSYGLAPDYSALGADAQGYLKEALDQNTLDLAAKNEKEGISSHARLGHENDLAMRRIPATLAGRGLLRSGQTGADLGEQAQTFKNQGYDMLSALMQGITGSVGQFQEAERQRQRDLAEAEMGAGGDAYGDYSDSYMDDGGGDTGPAGPVAGTWLKKRQAQLAAKRAAAARAAAAKAAAARAAAQRAAQASRNRSSGNPMHKAGRGIVGRY